MVMKIDSDGDLFEECPKCKGKVRATFTSQAQWDAYHATGWCKSCIVKWLGD